MTMRTDPPPPGGDLHDPRSFDGKIRRELALYLLLSPDFSKPEALAVIDAEARLADLQFRSSTW